MLKQFFLLFSITVVISQILTSCANITPVEGGERDTITPKAKHFYPKQNTLNFKNHEEIEITFDEKIEATQLRNEILISPYYGNNLDIKTTNHKVKIAFKDSLLPNTTYVIHFNKGIRDITEGNITPNLTYIFSTGNKIDSVKYSGLVKDIYTYKPLSKILVGLYKYSDTLNIKIHKPDYYTYTNAEGQFNLENIKPDKYKIFAIQDDNKNLKFESAKEKIGFLNTVPLSDKSTNDIVLNLVKQNDTEIIIVKNITKDNKTEIHLNKSIKSVLLQKPNSGICSQLNNERKIFSLYNLPFVNDSCGIDLLVEDSLNVKAILHTTAFKEVTKQEPEEKRNKKDRNKETEKARDRIQTEFLPKNGESVTEFKQLQINFDRPVTRNTAIKILCKTDNQKTFEIPESDIHIESQSVFINIKNEVLDSIKIIATKGSILTCTGDSLAILKHINKILKEEEMASLEGTLSTKESNYFIELVNEKGELIEKQNKNGAGKFHFPKLKPGNYQLKAVIDINNNGLWDCGNYIKGILPENIIFLPKLITLKQNWEVKEVNFPF